MPLLNYRQNKNADNFEKSSPKSTRLLAFQQKSNINDFA